MLDPSFLGERILSLYKQRKITINFKVEGKDVDSYIYVPTCYLSLMDEPDASSPTEKAIRESVEKEREYIEARRDATQEGKEGSQASRQLCC